jgi:2-keto-4-pentenoate hydratase/2-oxohepta-3-ene-1,7-dioic acid hydratase in catechol pathway
MFMTRLITVVESLAEAVALVRKSGLDADTFIEVPFPGDLRLWLEVDGHRYQDGTTKNLIFSVPIIIAYLSRFFELEPGDVIGTGTPAGVGLGHKPTPVFVKPGNVIELGVENLGTQRQLILAWDHQPRQN